MATPLQSEADDIRVEAEQRDVASVSVELRTNLVEGSDHPRFEVVGVEAVEEQQARNQLVPSGLLQDRAAWRASRGDVADEVGQGLTLEFEQGLDNLASSLLRGRIGETLDLVDQRFDPADPTAKVLVGRVHDKVTPVDGRRTWGSG